MNKTQSNHYRMFLNVQESLDSQSAVWTGIPKIVSYKNSFDELISRINDKDEAAEAPVSVTHQKESLRNALAVKLVILSGALQAYAWDNGDADLAESVKANKSDVIRLRDDEIDAFVRNIVTIAQNHLENLTDFNITEENLTEILTTLEDFNALIGKPRSILNQRYVALNAMDQLFDETNNLLNNKLDNIMKMFLGSQPEFYDSYQRAREIVDR